MHAPPGVKTNHNEFPNPESQRAWTMGDPGELSLVEKPVPVPKRAEVVVRIDAVAMTATAALRANPFADREEIKERLGGNICRCTGYQKIFDAVERGLPLQRVSPA